ncbi:MAG: 2-C-methyl-D-erythritol 2,4-cyclodiphosphate synthase [Longimicrobiales bacterium]
MASHRVGLGYDSHRFDTAATLVLGGVIFPDSPGLSGFSDGDAVAHAVIDALLGAASLGDVGSHFPPGQPEWKDADSMELLKRSVALLEDAGWVPGNVDITVVCEAPRIGPRAAEIRASLAGTLGIAADAVSIKGKTNETMGWIGRGEGIAVHAVAMVHPVAQ